MGTGREGLDGILGAGSYGVWNMALVDALLPSHSGEGPRPIEHLRATPEILEAIVDRYGGDTDRALSLFLDAAGAEFERRATQSRELVAVMASQADLWSPTSELRPPFFAFLWLLCLVATGYPENRGSFRERLSLALSGTDARLGTYETPDFRELDVNTFWAELAEWTERHRGLELALNDVTPERRHVGRAYWLVFPTAQDRRTLARILRSGSLLGFDPPVKPVVDVIRDAIRTGKGFSEAFKELFLQFADEYDTGGLVPGDDPVWMAIRREIEDPTPEMEAGPSLHDVSLVGWMEDEGLVELAIAGESDKSLPHLADSDWTPLEPPIGEFDVALATSSEIVRGLLAGQLPQLGALAGLASQGALFLREEAPTEYVLASGGSLPESSVALIRRELTEAFKREFGGYVDASQFEGWQWLWGLQARHLDVLPTDLANVKQLLRPTFDHLLSLVGGAKVQGRTYLRVRHLLPMVRAPWADRVECDIGLGGVPCVRLESGDWQIPAKVISATSCILRAEGDGARDRVTIEFTDSVDAYRFQYTEHGAWWLEGTCRRPDLGWIGSTELPASLMRLAETQASAPDLVGYGETCLNIGARVGEFVSRRDAAITTLGAPSGASAQWAIVKRPPIPERVPIKGAVRRWRKVVSTAGKRGVYRETEDGGYETVGRAALADYRALTRPRSAIPETAHNSSQNSQPEPRQAPMSFVGENSELVEDAIRALASHAHRRSRVSMSEFLSFLAPEPEEAGETGQDLRSRRVRQTSQAFEQLRSWQETWFLDVLRSQHRGGPIVVAIEPGLVALRRGPLTEATLLGLATPVVRDRFEARAKRFCEVGPAPRTDPRAPVVLRALTDEGQALDRLATELGLRATAWLGWGTRDERWETTSTRTLEPDNAAVYQVRGRFAYRGAAIHKIDVMEEELPCVEIRRYSEGMVLYATVGSSGTNHFVFRSHAMLQLAELSGRLAFQVRDGTLVSDGPVPTHLPLPIARLCVAMGGGVPGPAISGGHVTGYRYPFGKSLLDLLSDVLAPHTRAGQNGTTDA